MVNVGQAQRSELQGNLRRRLDASRVLGHNAAPQIVSQHHVGVAISEETIGDATFAYCEPERLPCVGDCPPEVRKRSAVRRPDFR